MSKTQDEPPIIVAMRPLALDVIGVAKATHLSTATIRRAVAAGELRQIKIGAASRFRVVDVEAYLAKLAGDQ